MADLGSIVLFATLAFCWPALEGVRRQRTLLAVPGLRAWVVIAGYGAGSLGLLLVGLVGGIALGLLPPPLIGYLGVFPLLRGLGRLSTVSFVARVPPSITPGERPAQTAIEIARACWADGADVLALIVPLFALATGPELAVFGALFVGQVIVAAGLAARGGPLPTRPSVDLGAVVRPWALLGSALVVMVRAGTLHWLLLALSPGRNA